MLDDFKEEQKVAYKIISNAINNNKLSHAYLFETNGYRNKREFLISVAKAILCPNHHMSKDDSIGCRVCENIDKNIYSELKIIEPDGMWIKKEQLIDLQEAFKTKGLESSRRVYIINDVECLNTSAANSILKFIEEPEEGIIAILATDNIHRLLDTIISRCQIITLAKSNYDKSSSMLDKISYLINVDDAYNLEEMVNSTIDYIYYLEQHKLDALIYNKNMVLNIFDDRLKLEVFFDIMTLFYKDVINYKINTNNYIFDLKDIEKIASYNDLNKLEKKINCIVDAKGYLKVNANTNLLIDKLVIDLEGDLNG
ncbi:MAG: hypothetical protein IJ715_01470 [Bacilli bacterium]|nr:hypothetical protein [Bacilli bacterium]